jgi:drug/metabolite transporter (DMT)-like permease
MFKSPPAPVLLTLGMVLFGSATPFSKFVGSALPVYAASWLRVVLAGLVLAPYLYLQRERFASLSRRDWSYFALIGSVGTALFTVSLIEGT